MDIDAACAALSAENPLALERTDPGARGYALDVRVSPDRLADFAAVFDRLGFFLETISAVDWLGENAAKARADKAAAKSAGKDAAAGAEGAEGTAVSDGAAGSGRDRTGPAEEKSAPAESAPLEAPPAPDDIEVVCVFGRFDAPLRAMLRARTPRDAPRVPTLTGVYPVAHWHEREVHEFFGVEFTGHPYLVPLLLPEDATFHPLRKDFKA